MQRHGNPDLLLDQERVLQVVELGKRVDHRSVSLFKERKEILAMRDSLKPRTLLLLVALVFTSLALSHPEPAEACWIAWGPVCTYPNGVTCRDSPCVAGTNWVCNGMPDGSPSCYEEEYCCN